MKINRTSDCSSYSALLSIDKEEWRRCPVEGSDHESEIQLRSNRNLSPSGTGKAKRGVDLGGLGSEDLLNKVEQTGSEKPERRKRSFLFITRGVRMLWGETKSYCGAN